MKANAPEKLYLQSNSIVEAGKRKLTLYKVSNDDIEYIRTDAFIEKSCDTIKSLLSGYIIRNFHFGDSYDMDKLIEDFRKAMSL